MPYVVGESEKLKAYAVPQLASGTAGLSQAIVIFRR
jgi:hypothetical protein